MVKKSDMFEDEMKPYYLKIQLEALGLAASYEQIKGLAKTRSITLPCLIDGWIQINMAKKLKGGLKLVLGPKTSAQTIVSHANKAETLAIAKASEALIGRTKAEWDKLGDKNYTWQLDDNLAELGKWPPSVEYIPGQKGSSTKLAYKLNDKIKPIEFILISNVKMGELRKKLEMIAMIGLGDKYDGQRIGRFKIMEFKEIT